MCMSDHYMLGIVPALRSLQNQIPCILYKCPSDETINQGPACVVMQNVCLLLLLLSLSQ